MLKKVPICKIKLLPNNVAWITGKFTHEAVDKATSFYQNGFRFMTLYKRGLWDGKVKLYNRKEQTFPAGLVDQVANSIEQWAVNKEIGLEIDIEDHETYPDPTGDYKLIGIEPRDYQLEAAEALIEGGRGILKAATNAGKTAITAMLIKRMELRTIIIVPSIDLLHQTAEKLQAMLGGKIGLIGDGKFKIEDVTVAMPSTLIRRITKKKRKKGNKQPSKIEKENENAKIMSNIEILRSFEMVIADECHTLGSKTFDKVMQAISAPYRFGMSGTPLNRTDGADMRLIGHTGEILYTVSNAKLIELGYSNKVLIEFHSVEEPLLSEELEYADVYYEGVVNNYYRNKIIIDLVLERAEKGLQSLVVVKQIEHGENLEAMFPKAFPFVFAYGKHKSSERKQVLEDFRNRKIMAIISTKIFDVGIDVANIDILIMAASGKSRIETLQRLGRGVRTGGNSDVLTVIEFSDRTHKYLIKHSKERFKTYQTERAFSFKLISH